jgi:hypothetical protein
VTAAEPRAAGRVGEPVPPAVLVLLAVTSAPGPVPTEPSARRPPPPPAGAEPAGAEPAAVAAAGAYPSPV